MHDHTADGMLQYDLQRGSAHSLSLHLDNHYDVRASGWDFDARREFHHQLHNDEAERLAGIEAAANLLAEKLAEAPAAVVESVVYDVSFYLTDANGTLYLAESAGPGLYRLTAQLDEEPAPVVDLMVALEESLAAARATLGQESSDA